MLAQRLPGLLPPLAPKSCSRSRRSHSVAPVPNGCERRTVHARSAPRTTPPRRSAIVGGGRDARPGEISLAHHGVLFLDELPEFDRRVLEALREPLETARVNVSRTQFRAEYPADCLFVAAMNPCPCGFRGDPARRCRCAPGPLQHYRSRISSPLLDRLDLLVAMRRVDLAAPGADDAEPPPGCAGLGSTTTVAAAVDRARMRQRVRQSCLNARLGPAATMAWCAPDAPARKLLAQASGRLGLSARAYHRVLRVARTIADLGGAETVGEEEVAEALALRVAPALDAPVPGSSRDGDTLAGDPADGSRQREVM
jgi:magnesium chelatase family protein